MNIYLIIILVFLIGTYILDLWVERLNLKHFSETLPQEFASVYDQDKYQQSQRYLKATTGFGLLEQGIVLAMTVIFILLGGFNMVDQWARGFGWGSIGTGLMFAGGLMILSQILGLPFAYYDTFVLEERFGFNKTNRKTFVLDFIKKMVMGVVLGGILFAGIIAFFLWAGPLAWLYCWVGMTAFQIVLMFVAPVWIMPLFNKFTPLEEGELKDTIESYAKAQNFKMQGVFTIDGSRRSTKSNAFFTGFGRFRRIALFDTLIKEHTTEELVAVLAHEIGHYKKKHILKNMAMSIIIAGLMFYLLSLFMNNPRLFAAFRMQEVSIYASLIFFGYLYSPISAIFSVVAQAQSRKAEFEADAFAVVTIPRAEAMVEALKKLSVNNLSNLTPHPLKVFLSYSHPPVIQRIDAIRHVAHNQSVVERED